MIFVLYFPDSQISNQKMNIMRSLDNFTDKNELLHGTDLYKLRGGTGETGNGEGEPEGGGSNPDAGGAPPPAIQ